MDLGKIRFAQTDEVKEMWESYLISSSLKERVDCRLVKRIEFEPDFNILYLPLQVELVLPELATRGKDTDALQQELFPLILGRDIFKVKPLFSIHGSEIRRLVLTGSADWEQFIPPGAYKVFLKINGPERVRAATIRS